MVKYSIIAVLVIILMLCPFIQSSYAIDKYKPEIIDKQIFPKRPTPTASPEIVVKVIDRFGQIRQANIAFSSDSWKTNSTVAMELAFGIPSNGTFVGTIPPSNKTDLEIQFKVTLRDDLGYTVSYQDRYTTEDDRILPTLSPPSHFPFAPGPEDEVLIRTLASDEQSGIKNANLTFSTTNPNFHEPLTREMEPELLNKDDLRYINYRVFLPRQPENTTIKYFVTTVDYSGNFFKSEENSYTVKKPIDRNVQFYVQQITAVDIPNTATASVTMSGSLLTNSSYSSVVVQTQGYNIHNLIVPFANTRISQSGQTSHSEILELRGDPWNYPFDAYSTIVNFTIPVDKVMVASSNNIDADDTIRQEWRVSKSDSTPTANQNSTSFASTIKFDRNDRIFPIRLALVGSFYLLGAIFLLPNKDLTNRLVIAVAVLALIFSLNDLIDKTRPFSYGRITYADLSVSFLIYYTIAFAALSIVASFLRKWADGFVISALGGLIMTFVIFTWNYSSEATNQAEVLTQIGLVYGLAIRLALVPALRSFRRRLEQRHFTSGWDPKV